MKKIIAIIILAIFCTLIFSGCNNSDVSSADYKNSLIKVTAGGKTIGPYMQVLSTAEWVDHEDAIDFQYGDAFFSVERLKELINDRKIPKFAYEEDISISFENNVELENVTVYLIDEKGETEQKKFSDISQLSSLSKGNYYVGINFTEWGDYIEKIQKKEHNIWSGLFQLTVK